RRQRRVNRAQRSHPSVRDPNRSGRGSHAVAHHHQGDEEASMIRRQVLAWAAAAATAGFAASAIAQTITLHGAVQFNDDHAFNKSLLKFEELVKKYYGKPVSFVLHKNSELGLEKDYFAYMNQGKGVDYGIVSPAHMSTFS